MSPDYSIVIPVYCNEGSLRPTLQTLLDEVIGKQPERYAEVIFVEDGSGDGSLGELLALRREHPHLVKVVKLTRNFGQVSALLAGYSQARGRCVVTLSADQQDPPALINEMLRGFFDEGKEIVIAARTSRDDGYARALASRLFYTLVRRLALPQMPPGGFDFFLMGRSALAMVLKNAGAGLFLQGEVMRGGFATGLLHYHRRGRRVGRSRWSFFAKVSYFVDGLVASSALGRAGEHLRRVLGRIQGRDPYVIDRIWGDDVEAAGDAGEG